MIENSREQVFSVLLATMRPIASMLMKFGVSYKDFDRICRLAFVEVAGTSESGGRVDNVSRIAVRTGLTRKAVKAVQKDLAADQLPPVEIRSLPSEVLHIWHTDPRFCIRPGVPGELNWEAGPNSFVELVRYATTTVPPSTLRDELIRVGAVAELPGNRLIARRRSFVPNTSYERLIQGLQYGVRPLALTVSHNATTNDPENVRFQRIVWNYCLPKEKRGAIDRLITQRLEEISQEIDDLLGEVEVPRDDIESSVFGVGLYHFEDDPGAMPAVDRSGG